MQELARVYARSLFEVAREHSKVDLVRDQLRQFADALRDNRQLATFFYSPSFSAAEKEQALDRTLQDADPHLLNFLKLLIANHRMPVIPRISREYQRLWDVANHRLPVQVTSAVALDDAALDGLSARIAERTGQTVQLTTNVQPDILGGIVVRIGNSILDASVRGRLERLRRQLTAEHA